MQDLQQMKIAMAQIKLSALQRQFQKANNQYMQTIKNLKQILNEKTSKQSKLGEELTLLKKLYIDHNQFIQEAIQLISSSNQSIQNDKSINRSKVSSKNQSYRLFKKKSMNVSLIKKEKNSKLITSLQTSAKVLKKYESIPLSTNSKNISASNIKSLQCLDKSLFPKFRSSYDVSGPNKIKNNPQSNNLTFRRSQKTIPNPQNKNKWK